MLKIQRLLYRQFFTGIALLLLLAFVAVRPVRLVWAQSPDAADGLAAALAAEEKIPVVILLDDPEPGAEIRLQAIAQSQADILAELPADAFTPVHRYETLPGMAGEVTASGLEALMQQPVVAAIALDLPVKTALSDSVPFINADDVWRDFGFTGAGLNVAVLDTGIDPTQPDLADHLVAEHCFNRGNCLPDRTDESENARDENGHGTHVAGIITGRGHTAPRGVASGAGIVAVRVLGSTGFGSTSDVLAALDWVLAHHEDLAVKVINLSLGGGSYADGCDEADANTRLYAAAVERARQAGMIVLAASGNSGHPELMMAPACVSGVVAVGNVYDTVESQVAWPTCLDENVQSDRIPCSSNSSPVLDLLAPGVSIRSTAMGGGQETRSGTSMSTPHASAVAALVLEANPGLSPAEVEMALLETGVPVTDERNGRVTPRLDALAAVSYVSSGQATVVSGVVLLSGRTDHGSAEIFLSETSCAEPVFAEPAAVTNSDGAFEITLPAGRSYRCLQARQPGYLGGQSDAPGPDMGVVTLPGGDVTGDGVIDIFDLAFMGSRYNSSDPSADLNRDGTVNIFDLVLPASNYDRRGPVITWQ